MWQWDQSGLRHKGMFRLIVKVTPIQTSFYSPPFIVFFIIIENLNSNFFCL